MCGIVGFSKDYILQNYENLDSKLNDYWNKLSHRGEDSYGILTIYTENNKIKFHSLKSLSKEELLKDFKQKVLDKVDKENVLLMLCHNRKASIGDVSLELAHPVVSENSIIIHNGTKKAVVELFSAYESDTQAFNELIEKFNKLNDKKLLKQLLSNAGVIFHFDLENLKIIFHKSNRSLYYNEVGILSSEPVFTGEWYAIKKIGLKQLKLNKENIINLFSKLKKEDKKFYYIKQCRICDRFFYTENKRKQECEKCHKNFNYYNYYNKIYKI